MEQFREIITQEECRIQDILGKMKRTLAEEQEDRQNIDFEISKLKQQKLETNDWKEKQEINERIASARERRGMRHYQESGVLRCPYFAIMELEDDDLGGLSYCMGSCSFFDSNSQVLVIDWREAPISRLYYEYDTGEEYEESIQNRERSGIIQCKRKLDTTNGELRKIAENGCLLVRGPNGIWEKAENSGISVSHKEASADHRLPEIAALISREQFRTITQPEANTILLQGGAGSGKTTVGLHRVAYLAYQNPARFRPDRILVVMFNRSLQRYISRTLPEMGVGKGVLIETYHRWASILFRASNTRVTYSSQTPPPGVTRFKKHAVALTLVDRYLKNLLWKSRGWFIEQLRKNKDPNIKKIKTLLRSANQFEQFFQMLKSHPVFYEGVQPESRDRLRMRLIHRFEEHEADLYAALTDSALLDEIVAESKSWKTSGIVKQLVTWQTRLRDKKQIDFADTGILLWLMQRKGVQAARPNYAHIMADEAQDLSEVELATLLYAADKEQSVTICGDMAQKIKGDVSFENAKGFTGFIRELQERTGNRNVCADTLKVGFRATRQIMELAWHILKEKPSMTVLRDGDPVEILRTRNYEDTVQHANKILRDYLKARPNALIGVVCRYKSDANQIAEDLKHLGLKHLRRHERDNFSFQPGIIVTNAHQVKGLEFSGILVINPEAAQYRDNRESRMLLHVVITRATDRLWIIGHRPMAYGIEN
ncbi:UvrD-helicase domain-containing protein [Desulfonema magnum]|uniref:ATP-dependent DNA helicase n=1 Tax=Desulfonema magnum TaxID=45655 RepID=A0A975BJQ5_9BACT|nr:UvrD-helicase domain-containing protein [Desulfonema magnum]QTA86686.1 ATP-dependent DNA helicase [Desulfonema magnum]